MNSMAEGKKPHAVCVPLPFQSHIKAMLKLAKLLHHRGFHITFVNTEYIHKQFLKSLGPNSLDGLPDFRYETIPDGHTISSDKRTPEDIILLFHFISQSILPPFLSLIEKLNTALTSNDVNPPVTYLVSDGFMSFTTLAAEKLGIPIALFFTFAASSFMGFMQYPALVKKGLAPLKDESYFTNGFLDKVIDWIPGMKTIRLKDLPTVFQTTNPDDVYFRHILEAVDRARKASAVVVHTFDALEQDVLAALSSILPHVYAVGPLQLLLDQILEDPLKPMGYSLWKEETECLKWLNAKASNSVVYVNFGSASFVTPEQFLEIGWGLANSKLTFFWVIRPDLVIGESAILPPEFVDETKGRSLIASWCPQEQVLNHPSIGGFLTHSGWNSTIESVSAGVPLLCCPFHSDQQTNCHYTCKEWGIGMEMDKNVKREEVEKLVRELMEGEKATEMRNKAMEWKKLAEEATSPHGSSSVNLNNLVNRIQQREKFDVIHKNAIN
ncbi:7-deoxyloganetin glucosyltransferase-like [Pyrus ussuriensis x Pyrus communis]|uniref:Glycosyltransferase n=1 Tax=Pyrus ussuriensis x Pyrus communis TaxID=2448454 RepID=A0A5N5GJ39_9ROSA|nr:7-deoxyloganetin glucosyltransferase-like [Pyrus ussuriensis x Pyrus communis]